MDCQVRRDDTLHAISTTPSLSLPHVSHVLRRSFRVCVSHQTHLPPSPRALVRDCYPSLPPLAPSPPNLRISTCNERCGLQRRKFSDERATRERTYVVLATRRRAFGMLRSVDVVAYPRGSAATEYIHTSVYRTRARTLRNWMVALANPRLTSRAAVSVINVRRASSQLQRRESHTALRAAH